MIEILVIIVVIIGFIGVLIYLAPETRNRGVRDNARVIRAAETAEREMDHRRDRIADRERRRQRGPGRRQF
ncbi:MAG: hypothetical protein ACW98Y_16910 [Candidatus Thorarchaeota archaeon]